MKYLITVAAVIAVALTVSAGQVTEFADTFTGVNGTSVAPGANWNYVNIGVELADWVTYPRPDAKDLNIISNNQLFMYVGPCTNNPAVYNKVQAAITPTSSGTPVWLTLTNGMVEASFDLREVNQNAGNRWNLGQEIKLALSATSLAVDPSQTNMYILKLTIRPTTPAGSNVFIRTAISTTNAAGAPVSTDTTGTNLVYPIAPTTIRMTLDANAVCKLFVGGALVNQSTGLWPIATCYPYIWHGMFNGEGGVTADGNAFIDNYDVKWTPEPGLLAFLLLAVPAFLRFRK
jgi:hypothetical protein